MKPKVSVIVPIYKVEKYLHKCIESLINQTLKDIEIILVNDGSPDNCGQICDMYAESDQRIKVVHQVNSGANVARNNGLKVSTGTYIAFVDGDDYVAKDAYEKLYTVAKEYNLDLVNSNHYTDVNGDIKLIENSIEKNKVLNKNDILNLCKKANSEMLIAYAWRNLIRRSLLEEKSIKYNEELSLGQETPFMLEVLFAATSMMSVDNAYYYYVFRNDSKQGSPIKRNLLARLNQTYQAKVKVYKKYGQEKLLPDLYRYTINHYLVMLLSNIIANKQFTLKEIKHQLVKIKRSSMINESYTYYPDNSLTIQSFPLKVCIKLLKDNKLTLLSLLIVMRKNK